MCLCRYPCPIVSIGQIYIYRSVHSRVLRKNISSDRIKPHWALPGLYYNIRTHKLLDVRLQRGVYTNRGIH